MLLYDYIEENLNSIINPGGHPFLGSVVRLPDGRKGSVTFVSCSGWDHCTDEWVEECVPEAALEERDVVGVSLFTGGNAYLASRDITVECMSPEIVANRLMEFLDEHDLIDHDAAMDFDEVA